MDALTYILARRDFDSQFRPDRFIIHADVFCSFSSHLLHAVSYTRSFSSVFSRIFSYLLLTHNCSFVILPYIDLL
jgi:hypothetical protein